MHTYLDDVIIFSTTLDQHIGHIQEVLECFEKSNLEVKYLGYIVTPNGFKPNVRNVEAIREFPVPITLKEPKTVFGIDITLLHIC